jgi:hypothetical protein
MFSLIWRFLPGPAWLRIIAILAVAAVIVYALITWVYPAAAELLMNEESTVNQ